MTGPTFPASETRKVAGFTLIELTLALAILGLIAVLTLPRVLPSRSSTALRIAAYEIAALLRDDRASAARTGRIVTPVIDGGGHRVLSGVSGRIVDVPPFAAFGLRGSGLRFLPDGSANDALVVITGATAGYGVRVNGFSGAIDIVPVKP
ncbi:pilus assembly FimT family protein [Oryzibacter oryziterrae]|uniref:pilus assembly FimT family protein n=1 Tax=Oryzibacter oryziterrae TaxID=2766474 RepID=UPI001F2E94BE|nr:prepilin-type N-terminal cleavage/methylation domain-containing protein [Oryzibacter oryziterrae]